MLVVWLFEGYFFSFILVLSCLSNPLAGHVLLKCNQTWVVWGSIIGLQIHSIRFDQKCSSEQRACCLSERVNDIIKRDFVCSPSHVLSIYLMFIVLLSFPIRFYMQRCSECVSPLFSASFGATDKVSSVLLSHDLIITWKLWSWRMRLCPPPSCCVWWFLGKYKEN